MKKSISLTDRVGDIVTSYPRSAEVFKAYRIDFCCGGNKTLLQVIHDQHIEEQALLMSLQEAVKAPEPENVNWSELSSSELINYIVRIHHGYLRTALPHLSEYVKKVARVHGPYHSELFKVYEWFETLKSEMEQHMEKEEQEAFPAVIAFENDPTEETIAEPHS